MTAHTHTTLVAGCYRCELGKGTRREAARREARIEAGALRDMARDFRDVDMLEAADLCDEKAAALAEEAS